MIKYLKEKQRRYHGREWFAGLKAAERLGANTTRETILKIGVELSPQYKSGMLAYLEHDKRIRSTL